MRLRLYQLENSPNSMKARIALGYKGLPYDRFEVNAQDRVEIVRLSGQPLTPVLVHDDTVIFDSAAILRYLEANFRAAPPLFAAERQEQKRIEEWERFGRDELYRPIGELFAQARAAQPDPAACARASDDLQRLSERIEARLAEADWLVADRLTAADVTCAPLIAFALFSADAAARSTVARFFRERLQLGDERPRTREWAARVITFDR
ncbi:MAG TPA: glutathione S-transferase family protein [Candidatus Polarisedimenticolaceae bacterium]|nr:glutathione S-transferase family protein [Candidatus Polarisedimenticolaceae bacterium]